ncbi:hypothetical protein OPAG_02236 [Rhodococcus opacus PD630]|nr:hypothetical protein OPAG_02236 [Rhodococcus opacus PD630]
MAVSRTLAPVREVRIKGPNDSSRICCVINDHGSELLGLVPAVLGDERLRRRRSAPTCARGDRGGHRRSGRPEEHTRPQLRR